MTGYVQAARSKPKPRGRVDSEHLELTRAMRVATLVGLFTWPSFMLLDVYMTFVVAPETAFAPFIAYRAAEQVMIAIAHYCLRPTVDGSPPSQRRIAISEALVFVGAAVTISLMALRLGGLRSNYVHGISIVVLVRGAAVPSRWRRTLTVGAAAALSYPVIILAHGLISPSVEMNAATLMDLAHFASNYIFVIATVVLTTVSSHAIWAARKAVTASRKLGRYVLKARIGVGGMGEVWLARDGTLGRNVAFKMLRVSNSEEAAARFEREAQAMSALSNPHTVRVFDFGSDDDGTLFIAMEHLIGADLGVLVEEHGAMPPARALRLTRQACASLIEAHDSGIIHRDIKPENLFVTRAGDDFDFLKLLDFGMAKIQGAQGTLTAAGITGGTPRYLAPELWMGGTADERSDIYALGGVLYYLLAGRPPFEADSITALAAAHAVAEVAPPSSRRADTGRALDQVVLKCLAKNPAERFQSMRELDDALAQCAERREWSPEDARLFWTVTRPQTHERGFSTRPPAGDPTATTVQFPRAPQVPRAVGD